MTVTFRTQSRHGYSVKFSPYFPNRLACSSSQYYGIAGCGTLFVLELRPDHLVVLRTFDWSDGLFDVAWSESNENVLVTASGDGSLLVWDVLQEQGPLKAFKEHTKEVNSVDWSLTRGENLVVTGSWDTLIKIWDLHSAQSLVTFRGHDSIVYSAGWSPHVPACFASVSGDQTLRVWDARKPNFPTRVVPAHSGEILTCDWCKYDQNVLFTGGVDGLIRGWDIRNTQQQVCELRGHQYAIRRIRTSPFMATKLISCSYDFTTRIWDYTRPEALEVIEHHTEFVYGLDFNLHVPGQIADCGWDELLHVFRPQSCIPAP
ncbi:peroxisomal targeting signal 2 receptor-like [Haliotis asinina]|uniref:peroxisomal targeting signal 2 receptor-like n=1 Tax=Haliotis asinina TaxID=109174 RepID=UPI0035323314